ncbi:O-antigen ligase family protein [Tunturibacter empetritectus]|uniref:O-antigen ligase n=1 Tax=Tunturiibacter lichenicola TaxID=2051959 RepID=A0A7W8JC18_9BACT|nr:O-antigen ligase family protein [Edaphobacter lichenicola]MBB5345261.1 O-antigen ligase [Edaphobacter lichenicola]
MATADNSTIASQPRVSKYSASAFCVGFYFAIRVVTTVFFVRILGADPQVGAATNLTLNFLLLGFIWSSTLGTSSRDSASVLTLAQIRWVLIFLGFSGCSLLWSETASPLASAAYWCGTVSDVAIIVLLLRNRSGVEAADSLMTGFVWGGCCIALVAWVMPTQFDMRLGDEDYLNANTIGNLCAFAIFFAQYLRTSKKARWGPAIFFLAITLVRSLSKTAIVAFLISEGYLVIHDRVMNRRTKTYLTIGVAVVVLVFWGLFEAYYDFYTTYGNQSETLTGRTAIWAYVVDAALAKPWIGYGFDSMWKVVPAFGAFEARHAENELLEQLYSYGIAGLVMLCGVYGSLYRKVRKLGESPLRIIFVGMLMFVIIRGLAEAEPFDLLFPLWAIVLVTSLVTRTDVAGHHIHPHPQQSEPAYDFGFKSIAASAIQVNRGTADPRS